MLTDIFISSDGASEESFDNGVNIALHHADNSKSVIVRMEDDGGKLLLPEFPMDLEELRRAFIKLGC